MLIITKRRYKGAGRQMFTKQMDNDDIDTAKRLAASTPNNQEITQKTKDILAKLINKGTAKRLTSNNQEITQKTKDTLAKLINEGSMTNINKLIAGSGKAISIQDLVRGSGLKIA
jgi:hypothetical protein